MVIAINATICCCLTENRGCSFIFLLIWKECQVTSILWPLNWKQQEINVVKPTKSGKDELDVFIFTVVISTISGSAV